MSNPQQSSGIKITPGDVIYTIFRHLKKIIFFIILGLASGLAVYKFWPKTYNSQAQILVKYITENKRTVSDDGGAQIIEAGTRVMRTELAILNSVDLATEVVKNAKERSSNENLKDINAGDILGRLDARTTAKGSTIISVSLSNPNREIVRPLLDIFIETYLDRHFHIHQDRGSFDDFLTQQTDQAKARLNQTEEEIVAARSKAGVLSVAQARQNLASEIGRIRQILNDTKTEIAENRTSYNILLEQYNLLKANNLDIEESNEETPTIFDSLSADTIRNFDRLRTQLEILKSRESNLLARFTPESDRYQAILAQIADTEKKINDLKERHPGLTDNLASAGESTLRSDPKEAEQQLQVRQARISSLEARQKTLEAQIADLGVEAARLDQIELTIGDLERRKRLEESNYNTLLSNLERNRFSDVQNDGQVSNITIIQSPTPPSLSQNSRTQAAAGVAGGIGVLGLLWAFAVDLLLDRSIKRPTEIQRNLGIPLFMSLPDLNDKRFRKINKKADRLALQQTAKVKALQVGKKKEAYKPKSPTLQAAALSKPEDYGSDNASGPREIAPWDDQHALNSHFDALRDKVITYFESKNLTHKPKLIAMTGLGQDSGVTTIASGLAGSLSKIGEGNVLLVDMTLGHETAQQFYNGKNILNLDQVLDHNQEGQAKVENNLYVVAEGTNGTKLPRIMPQRFNKIMPKLRASDFDYIIFDMPPVSPISSTPRLASFMDVVLMVMESEETNRDVANQALELLADSKAHLGGILNKTKSRVPRKLEQDLLSQA